MQETLPQQRVRAHSSPSRPSIAPIAAEPPAAKAVSFADRLKRALKNPLVLVGITWMLMAVLLAREIIGR